jgi:hypothetical protein
LNTISGPSLSPLSLPSTLETAQSMAPSVRMNTQRCYPSEHSTCHGILLLSAEHTDHWHASSDSLICSLTTRASRKYRWTPSVRTGNMPDKIFLAAEVAASGRIFFNHTRLARSRLHIPVSCHKSESLPITLSQGDYHLCSYLKFKLFSHLDPFGLSSCVAVSISTQRQANLFTCK